MAEKEVAPAAGSSKGAKPRLSITSRRYDIDGDGKLDEAEQGIRDLDKSGRGYLTNDKVYGLMQDHMKTQKELFSMRRMMIALACFTVVLAISNLGTALAAAVLAKETRIANEALVDKKTGAKISTVSEAEGFGITVETDAGSRRTVSCREDPSDPNNEICFETAAGKNNDKIKYDDVVTLRAKCLAGHSVFLKSDTCGPDYICGTAQGPSRETNVASGVKYTFDELVKGQPRVTVTCGQNNANAEHFDTWCYITEHTGCAAADESALVCALGGQCDVDNCEETKCCTVDNPPAVTKDCACDTEFGVFDDCNKYSLTCDAEASTYVVDDSGNCVLPPTPLCSDRTYWTSGGTCSAAENGQYCDYYEMCRVCDDGTATIVMSEMCSCDSNESVQCAPVDPMPMLGCYHYSMPRDECLS